MRHVLQAVIDRRIRPLGRPSWPTESILLPSSVVAILFVSHEETLLAGSARVIAIEMDTVREPFNRAEQRVNSYG